MAPAALSSTYPDTLVDQGGYVADPISSSFLPLDWTFTAAMRSTIVTGLALVAQLTSSAPWSSQNQLQSGIQVQLGPRPYFLAGDMDASPLKDELLACSNMP